MNESLRQLNLSREEEIFASHIEDLVSLCDRKNIPKFSGFLDLRQQKIAQFAASFVGADSLAFYGGFENAERKMFGVFPGYVIDKFSLFPIDFIEILHSRPLTHRDFLGSLMSLGIKREVVGDIIVGEDKSFVALQNNMSAHIIDNVSKIGNVGVKLRLCSADELGSTQNKFEEDTVIVSSMRLDCVVAALSSKSRADSAKLVLSERVNVNHEIVTSVSKCVSNGDTISIRSFGKFVIGQCNAKTKKGRLVLCYKKYI